MLLLLSLSLAIKMGREAETVARIFISFRWGRVEGGRNIFHRGNAPNKTHRTHVKSLSRRAHCILRISPPFAHYIIQQVNCHASSNIHYEPVNGSLLHRLNFAQTFSNLAKQSPSFSQRCGNTRRFFFFFLFFFSNPRTITLNERSLFAYNRLLSNRQISVSIVRSNRYRMLEWKFRSVENRWWKEMERKRGRKRNGDKNQTRPFLISLLYFWSKSILRVMSTSRNL